jgi:hypothetical protein
MSIVMKIGEVLTGVAVDDNYSETELVIIPDREPPPEASSDGSRNPSPPEPSGDGSEPEPDSNSESNSKLPAEADELDGEPIFAAVFLRMALERGCTVGVIGITSGRNEPLGDQVSPNDPRAQGWMLLARCPDSDEDGICAEVIWRDRAAIGDFIQQHADRLPKSAPELPPQARKSSSASAERRVSGLRPEVNDGTAPPKPNRQTLPDWRRHPEEYGVALLHADAHKAMEVADAIFTSFFAITEASENPLETAKQMSSGYPPIMHKLYEMRERIAELEAENDRLKITLRDQARSEAGAEAEAI